jgi:hypothetical protein
MFVKPRKFEVLNVEKDFDSYSSEEKCIMVDNLETMHCVNYYSLSNGHYIIFER